MSSLLQEKGRGKLNRNEKKARKALSKLGMKPYPGVNRVAIKKSKEILFVVKNPEVMKSPTSDTFIIFGEAKIEDLTHQAASRAAKQFASGLTGSNAAAEAGATEALEQAGDAETAAPAEQTEQSETATVDDSGLSPKDIELVMSQANVSKEKAVETLKKHEGDIVNTIMELTVG